MGLRELQGFQGFQGKIMDQGFIRSFFFRDFCSGEKSCHSMNFQQPKNPTCQFWTGDHFGPGAPGAEEPKKLRFWCCYVIQYVYYIGSWKPQTTNLKWMEMVKQPFKTACLEFQVLIFFRSSYTSSQTSCKKTYTEKRYQI